MQKHGGKEGGKGNMNCRSNMQNHGKNDDTSGE